MVRSLAVFHVLQSAVSAFRGRTLRRSLLIGVTVAIVPFAYGVLEAAAETRSYVCTVAASQLNVQRWNDSSYVSDSVYASVAGCGGRVNPGDTVSVRIILETPISVKPQNSISFWAVGAGLSSGEAGFGPIYHVSQSTTVSGINVRETPITVAGGSSYVLIRGDGSWQLTNTNNGANGNTLVLDPTKEAVISGITVSIELPTTFVFGGELRTLTGHDLTIGSFVLSAYTYASGSTDVVGPMLLVGSTASRIATLQQETTILLRAEAVVGETVYALTTKLNAAFAQLADGEPTAAAGQMRAYVNQVNALVNAGTISEDTAEKLTAAAIALIKRVRPR